MNAADPWSLLSRSGGHCLMTSIRALLLVLLELDDLLLYRVNVLLPDVHVSGIDSGLPSLCLWVPWYLQSRKAQRFDCLCDVGPTFILYPLSVCSWLWHRPSSCIWPRILRLQSKVWLSSPNTFVTNSSLVSCPTAFMGRQNFLAPTILGLASDMFSLSF